MGINVSLAALRQAADDVDAAGSSAHENIANSLTPSADAAQANPGWLSSDALMGCRQSWLEHLTDVIDRTAQAAENLRASAKDYEDVERRITEALTDMHWEAE
ncbi:hypothetical protein [Saccharothrix obliqua]|uniref:hypothetical protein n=1 Tax=Saccharothrix obliqua TaxID=2861747 RepID=UPI001C5FDE71|nr:hypothetical protein [Saccharothrix obliqua]MBW4719667.1 hypothetical protein [Saccharothrix obliqua]